jgi:hypothetical protein
MSLSDGSRSLYMALHLVTENNHIRRMFIHVTRIQKYPEYWTVILQLRYQQRHAGNLGR